MDPIVAHVLRACFALLFAAAALHKLRDLSAFRDTVARYELLPSRLARPAAALVVAAELTVAATITLVPWTSLVAAAMLALYALAIAINLARGRSDLDCGCMGPAAHTPISNRLVVRNTVLVALALALSTPVAPRALVWVDALTVLAATAALAGCWLATEQMLAMSPAFARLRSPPR